MFVTPVFSSRRFYLFGKLGCSFLLILAIFGCLSAPISSQYDKIFVQASSDISKFDIAPMLTSSNELALSNFKLPIIELKDDLPESNYQIPESSISAPKKIPKVAAPIEIIDKVNPINDPSPPSPPTPPKNLSLSIPKIGLNSINLVYGTNRNIPVIDKLLLNNPVIETQDAVNICSESGNSYIFGHSEPPDNKNPGAAGRIFGNLENLTAGDVIELVTAEGAQCKYKVDKWDQMVVDSSSNIDASEYYRAMDYPEKPTKSSLTIQTCKKGSSTVRLLLRASRID